MGLRQALLDVTPLRSSRSFRRLWVSQALSGLGTHMTLVAVMFQIWQTTNSAAWTGAVGLAQAIPLVALGPFAGSLVDRVDRRKLCLITTGGHAACSLLLALQGFAGYLPAAGVLGLVAVHSCLAAAGGPAARTFIPHLLPRHQLAAGLALNRIASQGAMLAGPMLGGLVVGESGVGGCYLIDALTFVVALAGVFGLPPMSPRGEPARPGLRGVLDGLAFLARDPVIRGALLTDLAATVLSMPVSLFPLINAERFGGDPRTLGLFLTAMALGGVAASLFSRTFTRLPRPGLVMLAGSATWGAALTLFGMSPHPAAGLTFLALAGAADTVSVVSRSTIVQTHTPDALLGRVSAAEQIVGTAGPDLGNMRGGLLADATSGTTALISGGLLCLVTVTLLTATTPTLRQPSTAPTPRTPSTNP
ncbi:MFS transporter [Sphaerisporangium krabiense]|uniref:MFS family permease n=1 Tax=Sphaerisporangium krabiense TaxID=763782 RepID=A0A7W9DUH1_9ACTN|nr:MFS transporter [Sphaerisporangium krabiense]MBB5631718.1 MFS family permease [Sphaerisporangium krabiense]GII60645.1 MFS transporter [Sphaerisporangium krabiense]